MCDNFYTDEEDTRNDEYVMLPTIAENMDRTCSQQENLQENKYNNESHAHN